MHSGAASDADGMIVGVTGRLTIGAGLGGAGWVVVLLGVGVTLGFSFGFTAGLVATGSDGGAIRIGAWVRSGEVRSEGVGVGVALGLFGGGTEGLTVAGGLTACGGSAPDVPGCSERTPPVMVTAATATAAATL